MAGGRGIQITGQGFGTNATVVKAMIGDYPCEVTGVSDILLECTTGAASNVKSIDNSGSDNCKFFFFLDTKIIILAKFDSA